MSTRRSLPNRSRKGSYHDRQRWKNCEWRSSLSLKFILLLKILQKSLTCHTPCYHISSCLFFPNFSKITSPGGLRCRIFCRCRRRFLSRGRRWSSEDVRERPARITFKSTFFGHSVSGSAGCEEMNKCISLEWPSGSLLSRWLFGSRRCTSDSRRWRCRGRGRRLRSTHQLGVYNGYAVIHQLGINVSQSLPYPYHTFHNSSCSSVPCTWSSEHNDRATPTSHNGHSGRYTLERCVKEDIQSTLCKTNWLFPIENRRKMLTCFLSLLLFFFRFLCRRLPIRPSSRSRAGSRRCRRSKNVKVERLEGSKIMVYKTQQLIVNQ